MIGNPIDAYIAESRMNAETDPAARKAKRDSFVAARTSNLAYALKNGQISEAEAGACVLGLFKGLEAEYGL